MTELMNHGAATQYREVTNGHMAGQCRTIGQDGVIANNAVMRHMHVGHEQIAIADTGFTTILNRAPMNGAVLTDDIVITDNQRGWLTRVFFVLAFFPDTGKLKYAVIAADSRWALDDHVGHHFSPLSDLNVRADVAPWANRYVVGKLGRGVHNRLRMDSRPFFCRHQTSLSAVNISATQTTSSSTSARHSNL